MHSVNTDGFQEIANIETLIADYIDSTSGILTPHSVMECLKGESDQEGLTHLGKLIKTCIKTVDDLDIIRWVAFHFDLPSVIPEWDETTTRNWISIHTSDQSLLNEIHRETINKGSEYISHIYAPSVVVSKMKSLHSDSARRLYEKWWIYCLDSMPSEEKEELHRICRSSVNQTNDILCFNCESCQNVQVLSCKDDIVESEALSCRLGQLLNEEDELEVAKRYNEFVKLIKKRAWSEIPNFHGKRSSISCNYYARVPMFFYSEPSRYMTEIFIAFYDKTNPTQHIVTILNQIVPALRICVSLINSHIAYAIEIESRVQMDIHSRLQEQAHTIVNNFIGRQLRNAISTTHTYQSNPIIQDTLFRSEILEISIRIALNRGLPDDFPRTAISMLKWLGARCESAKAKGQLKILDACKDITFDETSAAGSFTIFWNLWDNAEKVTRFHKSNKFDIKVQPIDDKSLEISFTNIGVLSNQWRNFLLGLQNQSPDKKRYTSGLEIVKQKMDLLGWKFSEIVLSDNTTIKILVRSRD